MISPISPDLHTEINFRISLGKLVWTVRQIRYAVCLWPLSAMFCTSICSLTTLNFCISSRFVFSDGGQRYLASHPLTDSNSFALQGWQLAPLASPSPSWASLTAVAYGVEFIPSFKNWCPCLLSDLYCKIQSSCNREPCTASVFFQPIGNIHFFSVCPKPF